MRKRTSDILDRGDSRGGSEEITMQTLDGTGRDSAVLPSSTRRGPTPQGSYDRSARS
jgi:hypothetical protein